MELGQIGATSLGLFETEWAQRWVGLTLPPTLGIPFGLAMADHQDLCHCTVALPTGVKPTGSGRPCAIRRLGGRSSNWLASSAGPATTIGPMATLRLFASVREAASGERSITIDGASVGEVVTAACDKFGDHFAALIPTCKVWVNGEPAEMDTAIEANDEVAILPPVSGG